MTNLKKNIAIGTALLTIGATSITTFAASNYKTPADIVASLTNKTVDTVITEKMETGKTYGSMASEAGKLDEFKSESIGIKKANINSQVANGTITQEKADEIIASISENNAICDGSGESKIGNKQGNGFGSNKNSVEKKGQGKGNSFKSKNNACSIPTN